jgi:hypothetical protein
VSLKSRTDAGASIQEELLLAMSIDFHAAALRSTLRDGAAMLVIVTRSLGRLRASSILKNQLLFSAEPQARIVTASAGFGAKARSELQLKAW